MGRTESRATAQVASTSADSKADPLTGINSLIRGSSVRLISSSGLGWGGVLLELHDASPAVRSDSLSADHIVALFTDHVSRGETAISPSRFVPYSYQPGAINLFPVGPIPACRPITSTKMIVCALNAALVEDVASEELSSAVKQLRRTTDLRDTPLRRLILLLAAEAESGGVSGKLYAEHLAHALALRFLLLSSGTQPARSSRHGTLPPRVLQRVLDRMKADFATDIDLKTLAAESGYSRSHFLRTFRAAMGCSPHQCLTGMRVEEAKLLLCDRSHPLIDIALACGFSNHSHFSNTFRQIVGMSPSRYRRGCSLVV
jgi:AraC family transcriptional regulator